MKFPMKTAVDSLVSGLSILVAKVII